ncbi:gamma-butyrobetaine hydroxylase-like domain-containing protein [Thalassovita taeanensis]|uniref:DUF971 family protein n=1 Tax=Thalassovita taeanensis TaxID=657014 RepID=A0A1H9JXX2_9RHOB|nr:DUF971 domain-containing protein [Thalassovita taeanensis]SEQ91634.1 DUF971 family protein [Thalassovita taeanensis]
MIDTLTATPDCRALTIRWDGGHESTLSADILRREARDAYSTRERIDFGTVRVIPDIAITALVQVGHGGVNVHFSDGHDRAIYPFEYLRELSHRFDN